MEDDVVGMAESAKRDDAGTPPPCRRACIDNSLLSVQDGDGADYGDDSCLDSELDGKYKLLSLTMEIYVLY